MTTQTSAQTPPWTFRRVAWATLVLVLVVFSFWLLYRFYQVVFILFFAIIMGTVIRPVVTWLHGRGISRIGGVVLVYLLLFGLLISFVLLLYPLLTKQGATIAVAVPDTYQNLRAWASNNPYQLIVRLGAFLPLEVPSLAPIQQTGQQVLAFAGQAFGFIKSAGEILVLVTAILMLAYHWTLDGPRIIRSLLLLVSKDNRERISGLIFAMESKVGSYVAGQSFLCLIIGAISLVFYLLIGLPNALVLALIAGIFEAVPLIGPVIGAIPAGIIALTMGPSKVIWVIVATLVIQQVEASFLVPRVMRKAVGVNPFISLLAIFSFSSLFGVAGAIMAIPIAAILQLILDHYVFHPAAVKTETSGNRDFTSRLRYEAQNLAQDLRKQARLVKGGSVNRVEQIDHVMDEIETITTDLDGLLAQNHPPGAL